MNYVDIILIIAMLLSIWSGWRAGFIIGAVDLIKWIGSLLAGFFLYQYAAKFFGQYIHGFGIWRVPVAFIAVIIVARILLALLLNPLIRNTPQNTHRSEANKFLGIIPGTINGIISAIIIAALLLAVPIWGELSANARNSLIANKLSPQVEWLDEKVSPVFNDAVNETINKTTVESGTEEIVELSYSVKNAKVREDLEARMLELVNKERAKQGLKPLQFDAKLQEVARAHSRDMLARSYFSHYTPEGKDPFDRMRAADVTFLVAGENLALAQTLKIAHNGLMNSPGHRANILRKSFGRCGIGVLDAGIHGLMISQEFRN